MPSDNKYSTIFGNRLPFSCTHEKGSAKKRIKKGRRATHTIVLRPIKGFVGALFVRQLFEVGAQSAHPKLKSLGKRELKCMAGTVVPMILRRSLLHARGATFASKEFHTKVLNKIRLR